MIITLPDTVARHIILNQVSINRMTKMMVLERMNRFGDSIVVIFTDHVCHQMNCSAAQHSFVAIISVE